MKFFDLYPDESDYASPKVAIQRLLKFSTLDDISQELSKEQLDAISSYLLSAVREDEASMAEWKSTADNIMKLATLEHEPKSHPFQGAANVKLPMITTAAIKWAARDRAEMSRNGHIVKSKIIGQDRDGFKQRTADRATTFLDWQVQEGIPGWEVGRDKLRLQLSIVGTAIVKTYWDSVTESVCSEFIPYDQFIVNDGIQSIEKAPQVTHILELSDSECVERQRAGLFNNEIDFLAVNRDLTDHTAIAHELYEIHTTLDLDGDGLAEPYIVTIHLTQRKIVRIVSRFQPDGVKLDPKTGVILRIVPDNYFTVYTFIPNPKGTFFGWGYGQPLLGLNSTANTAANQLINAGHYATTQSGLISKNLRMADGDFKLTPGQYSYVDVLPGTNIADQIHHLQFKEPSQVLFALLGTLDTYAKELSSSTDILNGSQDTTNSSPTTTLMLLRQGLMVPNSIQRRVFRSFKEELEKICKLNHRFLTIDQYLEVVDPEPEFIDELTDEDGRVSDFALHGINVIPIVDGNDSTDSENLVESQVIQMSMLPLAQAGAVDSKALAVLIAEKQKLSAEDIEKLVPPPAPPAPAPMSEKDQAEIQLKQQKLQLDAVKIQAKHEKDVAGASLAEAKSTSMQASATKTMIEAQLLPERLKLDAHKHALDVATRTADQKQKGLDNIRNLIADQTKK